MAVNLPNLPGFYDARTIQRRGRLIVAIDGLNKSGKTHFALTAPDPIAYFNLDIGLEGVVDKFHSKQVLVTDVSVPANKESRDYIDFPFPDALKSVKDRYRKAIATPDVRTIVIDTGTELWELMRMVRLGKLQQVPPMKYGEVNAEYRDLLRLAYDSDKNLILIHKVKPVYIERDGSKPGVANWNGEYKRAGMSETGYLVQADLTMRFEYPNSFITKVDDCRHNMALSGMELTNSNFSELAMIITGKEFK